MLWGLCRGVSKLRGLEQGGPHVGGSSKYEHRDRDPLGRFKGRIQPPA